MSEYYTFFEKMLERASIKIEAFADLITYVIDIILVAPCYENSEPGESCEPFEIITEGQAQKNTQNDWTLI